MQRFPTAVSFFTVFLPKTAKFSTSCKVPVRSLLKSSEKAAKAFAVCRYKRLIKHAARVSGPFPEYNPKLAKYIEMAKNYGVTTEAIDFSINITLDFRAKVGIYEVGYPGKCLIISQYEGIDLANIEHFILEICEEFDASFLTSSQRDLYYDTEAVIVVNGKAEDLPLDDSDKEKISSVGAKSIHQETDPSGQPNLILRCEPSRLHQVKRNILNLNYELEEAYVGFMPKTLTKLPNEAVEKIADLLTQLSRIHEIDRLYENVQ